jgi:hypothetical protein
VVVNVNRTASGTANVSSAASVNAVIGAVYPRSAALTSHFGVLAVTDRNNFSRPINIATNNGNFWTTDPTPKFGTHSLRLADFGFGTGVISDQNADVLIGSGEDFIVSMWLRGDISPQISREPVMIGVGGFSSTDMRSLSTLQDSWALGITFAGRLQFKWNNAGTFITSISHV